MLLHMSMESNLHTGFACITFLADHLVSQPQLVTSVSTAPCSLKSVQDVHTTAARSAARKETSLGKVHTARSGQSIAHRSDRLEAQVWAEKTAGEQFCGCMQPIHKYGQPIQSWQALRRPVWQPRQHQKGPWPIATPTQALQKKCKRH